MLYGQMSPTTWDSLPWEQKLGECSVVIAVRHICCLSLAKARSHKFKIVMRNYHDLIVTYFLYIGMHEAYRGKSLDMHNMNKNFNYIM